MSKSGLKLYIGLPTYGGQRFNTMALLGMQADVIKNSRFFSDVYCQEVDGSLLAASFNRLLIQAIMMHEKGLVDFFLLMHADIIPTNTTGWLNDLMEARQYARTQCADNEKYKAHVISVVSPIKDHRGVTSTAVEGPTIWNPRRLTMREIMAQDETFTDDQLLVNTAMLLIDLRNNDWITKVRFTISDAILVSNDGKQRLAGVQPEDWQFSRDARALGVKLWATRKVQIVHRGLFNYPNFAPWGQETDPGDEAPSV